MDYYENFKNKFPGLNERYIKIYLKFIKAKLIYNYGNEYVEKHHILPKNKNAFPEYELEKNNIIKLNIKDHIIAHYILYKAIPNQQNASSLIRTLGNIPKSGKDLSSLIVLSKKLKEEYRDFLLSNENPHRGKKRSEETKLKISKALKGKPSKNKGRYIWINKDNTQKYIKIEEFELYSHDNWVRGLSEDQVDFLREVNTGRVLSEETKIKQSESHKKIADNHHMKSPEKRQQRKEDFIKNNPSKLEKNKKLNSIRTKARWENDDYKNFMSKVFSDANKNRVLFYNKEENKFIRLKSNEIAPAGYVNAVGKTRWVKDENGKRKKVFIDDIE